MSRRTIFHLAGSDARVSGIAAYADLLDRIFEVYLDSRFSVRRITPLNFCSELMTRGEDDLLLVQLGTNEADVFIALNEIKDRFPDLRKIIEIHDPPHFCLTLNRFVKVISRFRIGRGMRRLHHLAFEDRYVSKILNAGDLLISKSNAGRSALRLRIGRLSLSVEVAHIPVPIYSERVNPATSGDPPLRAVLGFFGYINRDKGLHLVVNAAAEVAQQFGVEAVPRIVIRGSTTTPEQRRYLDELKSTVAASGLSERVYFGDFIEEKELPSFLESITALILPYISEGRKSASGPLMWAITVGKPVIAHNTAFFSEFIGENGVGILVPMQNISAWKNVLLVVAGDELWPLKFKDALLSARVKYSWKCVAAQYEQVFDGYSLPEIARTVSP